jgi:cobalt/nickel transport system permease protein
MRGQLEQYSRGDSPVHRLRAGSKLSIALLIVFATLATRLVQWPVLVGIAGLLLLAAFASRVPAGFLLRRLLTLEPFVLGVALLTLFQPGGGLICATLIVRSSLCLFTMVLLASTTPFPELLAVLRWLRVPHLLVTTLALMYRYLFVLSCEAQRMQRARQSRTFSRRRWPGWRTLATVISQLFVRATSRAERIYAAMQARGQR